jgi:hypothetical protein
MTDLIWLIRSDEQSRSLPLPHAHIGATCPGRRFCGYEPMTMSSWTLFFVPITNRWSRVLRCALCAPLPPASSLRCAAVINRSVRGDLFHQPILWVLISSLDHREHNRSSEQSTDHTIFLQQYLQHSRIGTCGIFCLNNVREDPVKITCCLRSCTALFSPYKGLVWFTEQGRKTLYQNSCNISFVFSKNYLNFD